MPIKHTPGPWIAQGPKISEVSDGQTYFSIIPKNPVRVDSTYKMPGFFYPHSIQSAQEMEANARLIAAAPELLEVLKEAHDLLQGLNIRSEETQKVFDVILKMQSVYKKKLLNENY